MSRKDAVVLASRTLALLDCVGAERGVLFASEPAFVPAVHEPGARSIDSNSVLASLLSHHPEFCYHQNGRFRSPG